MRWLQKVVELTLELYDVLRWARPIVSENMLILINNRSLKESGGCTNTIVGSLVLGVVSKLFEDEQSSKCGVVILGVFICLGTE